MTNTYAPDPIETERRINWAYAMSPINAATEKRRAMMASEWQPIKTAPWDDQVCIRTKKGRQFDAFLSVCAENENGEDCAAWREVLEGTAPTCWTDGTCWEVNADGVASDPPIWWKPLHAIAKAVQS